MSGSRLLLVALAVVLPGAVFPVVCPPDCVNGPPPPTSYPAFVAQPCNCSEFYLCSDESTYSNVLSCPPENPIFDQTTGECGPDSGICTTELPHSTCSTICSDSATTVSPGIQVIAHASNCSLYYMCGLGGKPLGPFSCPSSLPNFSGTECVADEAQCCAGGALCEAVCYEVGTLIGDPYDCTKYYICVNVGPAEELYHFSCDPGMNFDATAGACSAEAPCSPLCGTSGSTNQPPDGTDDCITSMECTEAGYFAMCRTCQPEYFYCPSNTGNAEWRECSGDLVFNPIPDFPYCVLPGNCPYYP